MSFLLRQLVVTCEEAKNCQVSFNHISAIRAIKKAKRALRAVDSWEGNEPGMWQTGSQNQQC